MADEERRGAWGDGNLVPVVGVGLECDEGTGGDFEGASEPLVDECSDAGVVADEEYGGFVWGAD
jgi:hypothetical protein